MAKNTVIEIPNEAAAQAAAELIIHRGLPRFHQDLNAIQSGEPNDLRPSAPDIVRLREQVGPAEDYRIARLWHGEYHLSDGTILVPKPTEKKPKKAPASSSRGKSG